jgi:hypothetical protein
LNDTRFLDGATVNDVTLIDQNLPYVNQRGEYNCGPACGSSTSGGVVSQEELRAACGGKPSIDPIQDDKLWQAWTNKTGRVNVKIKGGMGEYDALSKMKGGANVSYSLRGDGAGHSVMANRVIERTITKLNGKTIIKPIMFIMDPNKGQYIRISSYSILKASNTFLLLMPY